VDSSARVALIILSRLRGHICNFRPTGALLVCLVVFLCSYSAPAQTGTVLSHQKISDVYGGFTGLVDVNDYFGISVTSLGDLDADGVEDIAVGARKDDDGGPDRGAVWILFLNDDGTVKAHQKISDTQGGFTGTLSSWDHFGYSVASLDDIDGDGVTDIAVGAIGDDDGSTDRGAVWILFLNADGTVKDYQKISAAQGNFGGDLDSGDYFGYSTASLGDLDGDGIADIAVGAIADDDGSYNAGAVWILFLNADGTVKSYQKISDTQGGFTGTLDNSDYFGSSAACLGDLNRDGLVDIAVGARNDDDGGTDRGAIWILLLNTDGTVASYKKISDTQGGFEGALDNSDWFGSSVASLDLFDCDRTVDIAVGASNDDDGGTNRGAVWVLFLNVDGTVRGHQKISDTQGGFTGTLSNNDYLGCSVTSPGDIDGDGAADIVAGAYEDDDGGYGTGAVWVMFLYACPYELAGDMNCDCRVDFLDFAMIADNWLIDCELTPDEPACIPR